MSCQLGFSERVDAGTWDAEWFRAPASAEGVWEPARIIGKPGDGPWRKLVPSGIPPLTEETVWPVRVESFQRVRPVSRTGWLDIRNAMVQDSVKHANPVSFAGFAATVIRVGEAAEATIGFVSWFPAFQGLNLNGTYMPADAMEGASPERYAKVRLRPGANLLVLETAGTDHGGGLHFGIDCEVPFELESPLGESVGDSPFVRIGPFSEWVHVDHEAAVPPLSRYKGFGGHEELDEEAFPAFRTYASMRSVRSADEWVSFSEWLSPMPSAFVSDVSVFAASVWKREELRLPVPRELQTVCMANRAPAVIPLLGGGDAEFVLDFGKEWSGYLRFEADAPAGAVLDFYGFEYMKDGWRQDTYALDNTLRYTCKEGRQVYESPVRRGFRYLMVTVRGAARPVKLTGVQISQSNFPVAEIGRFHCSDPLLNDIWEISKHTTRLCMEDTFVDCPAYEQTFWVGDSRNEALVNYYVFGAADIVRRCLELVPGSKFQSPLYADQVPSGWSSVIPNWTFFWVIACLEYAEHTGDRDFARDMWPKVRFALEHYLRNIDERGLLFIRDWNLLDWAPIDQPRHGVVTHQNAVMAGALRTAAKLAAAAGEPEAGAAFSEASESLVRAINRHLWSAERQAYIDCIHADGRRSETYSVQTQIIAFLHGVPQGSRKDIVADLLLAPPSDFVQIGSPFMAFFYYEALTLLGRPQAMLDDMRKNYGQMIEHGATTCWEMYPAFEENRANPNLLTRSHCHAWSAAPAYFLGNSVLGVRRAEEGWRRVIVSPQPGDLRWARGAVPLPGGGRIDVSWRIGEEDGVPTFRLEVTAPEGIEMELSAPEGYHAVMTHSKI
ncbi:family 78 glycoside hydrolase catalytic domain [Cohnella caldifontis]|uniref:family 78 glycoside hydrolase catalytic domain n=1 Tax=Cohnella caldifontis TaxID=3027471 RepID=UPI0023EE0324|nr:family 78 glycoside hydrolase catalytic domain [Cohnella sp. YIM B05605]